ncbi:restriction endonuclease subunit S [Pseudomonas sp. S2_D06]
MAKVSGEYLPLSVLGEFPTDWEEATLEEVCRQVTDGTHDSPKQVAEGGYPLVTGRAIKDRNIDFSVTYNISDEDHQKVIERSKPERNDILFANIGNSIGDLVRVQTDRSFSIKNVALFKPNPLKIFPRYLEYFLLSEQVQRFIKGSTRGSAQPFIGLGSLRGFPISLPPMDEQCSIGDLLGSLDDRIDLFRDINATLEAIVQALFKSWFVDFDPVRAKAAGLEPEGMDAATAALFPDSFEESKLGVVPRGWRVGVLGDVAETARKQIQPNAMTVDTLYVGLEHIPRQSLALDSWGITDGLESAKSCFEKGDILFGKLRPYFHKVVIAPFVGVCSTDILVCKAKEADYYGFVAMQLFSTELVAYAYRLSNGAKMPRVNWKDLSDYVLVIPSVEVAAAYSDVVQPLFDQITANVHQAKTLAQLRDTLLPRLISGQLRLSEAEMVEEVSA